MMKRMLCLLLLTGLLVGCGPAESEPEQARHPTPAASQSATEPARQALISTQVPGCRGIAAMGGDVLVFGEDSLAVLDGATLEPLIREQIPGLPALDSGLVHVGDDRVVYFDRQNHRMVVLGTNLREQLRMEMPEDMVGSVCLSPDWKTVYYCTQSAVRALEIGSGISRLVKEQADPWLGAMGVALDGTLLHCMKSTVQRDRESVLLRVTTGEVLYEGTPLQYLQSSNGCVYSIVDHDAVEEIVFGSHQDALKNLWTPQVPQNIVLIPRLEIGVLTGTADGVLTAAVYHLGSGKKTAQVALEGIQTVHSMAVGEDNGRVWLLSGETLYCWDTSLSKVTDETVYTVPRTTRENPDNAKLAQMEALAAELGNRYGISILLGEQTAGVAPAGYSFETEYIPQAYQKALEQLNRMLSQFPDGFFSKTAEKSKNQRLTLVLVRGIYGSEAVEEKASAPGTQYWKDGNLYVALRLGSSFERYFYHELGHAIDTRVLSTSTAYDEWDALNPPEFQYDNNYRLYHDRTESPWLQEGWFIDSYSMSFAVEDRSRIFEYACLPDNEALFAMPHIQSKLQKLCTGIRQACDLEGQDRELLWEQYLQ